MRKIKIFYGPTNEFENIVPNINGNILNVYEMIKLFDEKQINEELLENLHENPYELFVAYTVDFSGLSDSGERGFHHILKFFTSLFNIDQIYIQNPTKVIENNIKAMVGVNNEEYELEIISYDYPEITEDKILQIYQNFSDHIIGQDPVKIEILTSLYSVYKKRNEENPLVLMFYGPSGVGKTESAKFLSEILNGKLLRIQVSMFQNHKSLDYLFGENHNAKSFAQDLLERRSNVILLDEFDKTFNTVYSAFYQMFDEGIFEDRNYVVDLKNTIIICTSNYNNLDSLRNSIGDPLYYRFNKLIEFKPLDLDSTLKIIELIYNKIWGNLDKEEKRVLQNINLLEFLKQKVTTILKYGAVNYRYIENKIEDLVNRQLLDNLISESSCERSEKNI